MARRTKLDAEMLELLARLEAAEQQADLEAQLPAGPRPPPPPRLPGARERMQQDVDRMVQDLLQDLPDSKRPVALELADQAARSLLWNSALNIELGNQLDGKGVAIGTLREITKVQHRLAETFRHGFLILELFRQRNAEIRATVIPITRRKKAAGGSR